MVIQHSVVPSGALSALHAACKARKRRRCSRIKSKGLMVAPFVSRIVKRSGLRFLPLAQFSGDQTLENSEALHVEYLIVFSPQVSNQFCEDGWSLVTNRRATSP